MNNVNYSSGFDQESYSDIVPRGTIGSYLDFDASYIDVVWEDNVEYKVRVTIKRGNEIVEMERALQFP